LRKIDFRDPTVDRSTLCSKHTVLILALIMALSAALLAARIAQKDTITFDDGISYLAATGHQGQFEDIVGQGLFPFGVWAKASDWQKLLQPECHFCFSQIASDLTHYDIHPPLYFWILHLWSITLGVHTWTGPSLNTVLVLLTVCILYGFAKFSLQNSLEAVAVALIWAVSPATISVSLEARQYTLLALITVVFVWQALKCADQSRQFRWQDIIALVLSTAAGALTHFQFSIVVLGCGLLLAARLAKANPKRMLAGFLGICAGYLLFFIVHPGFYNSVLNQYQYMREPFGFASAIVRLNKVGDALTDFFVPWHSAKLAYPFVALVLIFSLWLLRAVSKRVTSVPRLPRVSDVKGVSIIIGFVWISGTTILLYLAFLSPSHAMGPKYLSMAWPFLACALVFALRVLGEKRQLATILLCIGMLSSGAATVLHGALVQDHSTGRTTTLLAKANRVIIDSTARGMLSQIIWHVPDDKLVIVATQDYLLDNQDMWARNVGDTIYISEMTYDGTSAQQQNILDIIGRDHRVVDYDAGVWGVGNLYFTEAGSARRSVKP
jgi:hypothetical protein